MNLPLVARLLGIVAWLIGATMICSLPAAWPAFGGQSEFEVRGFWALVASIGVCGAVGAALHYYGKDATVVLYRKEAMAVVGLSWVMATLLGGLPYFFADVIYDSRDGVELSMSLVDACFEAQSGFSTTGATVLTDIENHDWVPRSILFWRSSTHFLGGLGIIVLFVAILGQGSAGKVLMRAEMPGPSKEGTQERMQHTAWVFAGIYCGLNMALAILLALQGMTWFDAICHAFGTMATGGFSTKNASIAGFDSKSIEYTIILFMILAGTNFTLLYLTLLGKPGKLVSDPEYRTYFSLILGATLLVLLVGTFKSNDFASAERLTASEGWEASIRLALFQVASIMTTTGFCTADFDLWNNFSRALLVVLMVVGGCAGSTGGGIKVIRVVLLAKTLLREVVHSYRPSMVRPIRLGGAAISDEQLPRHIVVYIALIAVVFTVSWLTLVAIEPETTWTDSGHSATNKLIDSASAVSATMHNIGPGLGIVGATQNYAPFSAPAKLLFILLMMLGRLELFAILVLVVPSFWRK